ncbi:MAG: HD-GYP domain-containing protein [Pseudomonadales bacterium]|nr:HD-GYP domain-containing protein [Pseudomonadales bacterium]
MNLDIVKLEVGQLKIGMYVSKLDRPWIGTPFPIQGLMIKSEDDLLKLRKLCTHVYVDEEFSKTSSGSSGNHVPTKPYSREDLERLFPHRKLKKYQTKTSFDEELTSAKEVIKGLSHALSDTMIGIHRGKGVDISALKEAINPMVSSITRNPDACIWLARMKNEDTYTYKHSMGASVWAVALGRQIGLPQVDLETLGFGTLLCDIGKLELPPSLLHKKSNLSDKEIALFQSHVEIGETKGITRDVLDIVTGHHERYNGTGYPKRLAGPEIPILARIAAIADSYDAMTSKRPYSVGKSPEAAIKELYSLRGTQYQAELVEEFIQAVGIYPAGTLVELSTGEVAVVISENKTRRLRPNILIVLNQDKKPVANSAILNLSTVSTNKEETPLEIVKSLEPGAYEINPEELYF